MAGFDYTIPLAARGPEMEQPVNMLARALEVRGLQQQNQLGQMKMDEYQRGIQNKNRLTALLGQEYKTPEERENALLRGGFMEEATKLGTDRRANLKTEAETAKHRAEIAGKKIGFYRDTVSSLADPRMVAEVITAMHSDPELQGSAISAVPLDKLLAQIPQDPAQFQDFKRRFVLGADKFVEDERARAQQAETARHNRSSEGLTARGQNITLRGQNLTDQRARERLQFEQGNAVAESGGPGQALLVKRYGKAPNGYRWKPDGTQEAVPGGPADIKAGEAGVKRARQMQGALAQADRVIAKVDEALGKVDWNTAGLGSTLANMPGTDARDLRATLDTIKANLGFAELQAMRDASPTGGALGAIAVQELIALQSTVASLDQAQSPAELERSLGQIRTHYENWRNAVMQSGNDAGGGDSTPPPQRPPKPAAPKALPANPTAQTLRNGEVYKLPNGKSGRWNGQAFEVVQ